MHNHIIICGLGNIGFCIFELLRQANQKIVVISEFIPDELQWQIELAGGEFHLGDARNDRLLLKAGIEDARAILAVTDKDVVNTTIAMDARRLNPEIKIIVRMHDVALGKHISSALEIHQIFSISELAAPIFARSINDNSAIGQIVLDNSVYLITEQSTKTIVNNDANDVLATMPAPSANDPSIDHYSLVIEPAIRYKKKVSLFAKLLAKLNYARSPAFSHLRRFLFILFCVIVSAALFLKWTMPLSYTDALYFVMTTITTVGYGDINFLHSAAWLKLFGCLLMLSGATAIAILFSSITEIILLRKLPSVLGGRPVPKKNHIVVVGSGSLGHRVVTTLLENNLPIAIVEDNIINRYSADINHQVALVEGALHSNDTLMRANVQYAKAILVITKDDIENLSISLAAKKINPNIINIVQIFSTGLWTRLQAAISLDRVLNVANIAAPYFAAAVFGDEILSAVKWKNQLLFISRTSGVADALLNEADEKLDQAENLKASVGVNVSYTTKHLTIGKKVYTNIYNCAIDLENS